MYLKGSIGCPLGPKSATVYGVWWCMFPLNHPQEIYPFNYSSHQKSVGNVDWIHAVTV